MRGYLGVALPLGRLRVQHAVERSLPSLGLVSARLIGAPIVAALSVWTAGLLEADVVLVRAGGVGRRCGRGVFWKVGCQGAAGASAALLQRKGVLEDDAGARRRAAAMTLAEHRCESICLTCPMHQVTARTWC
jgi:hypothetical protein